MIMSMTDLSSSTQEIVRQSHTYSELKKPSFPIVSPHQTLELADQRRRQQIKTSNELKRSSI